MSSRPDSESAAGGGVSLAVVPFGSSAYEDMKAMRERVLRAPLGLRLSAYDTQGEEAQLHIAAIDRSGVVRGTVLLSPISEEAMQLRQMAVADEERGNGLGRKLVAFAEGVAREARRKRIELNARISVQGFYEKLGYAIDGSAFIDRLNIPTVRMKKMLF
jgi:hypothetical protein